MKRRMTIDDSFTPCPANEGDELLPNGIFVINIFNTDPKLIPPFGEN